MSRDTRRFMATTWLLATAALTVAGSGCGRGDTSGSKSLGRTGADSTQRASLATRTSAEEQAALRALPAGPGHDLVLANCLTCHAATIITQQHKDTAGWSKTVTQMIAWGAPVAKDQQAALVAYLFEHFPARAAGEPSRQVR
jgi:cytochrome c5